MTIELSKHYSIYYLKIYYAKNFSIGEILQDAFLYYKRMDANDKPIEVNVFSHNEFELRGFNDSANGKKWTRGESVGFIWQKIFWNVRSRRS